VLLPPLLPARLLERRKRFLADVRLADGRLLTTHCPNPGAMLGLADPGQRVLLSESANAKRKLAHTWEFTALESGLVGVNTLRPNALTREALEARGIPELGDYASVRAEVKYGRASRIDFLLETPGAPPLYLEVKNVHLSRQPGLAEFPDCVAARSSKHMEELGDMADTGARAAVLFVVQRQDCEAFKVAHDIDPAFAEALTRARSRGVLALAYACAMSEREIRLSRALPII
jgi:sugar fermentation stimulation protein A